MTGEKPTYLITITIFLIYKSVSAKEILKKYKHTYIVHYTLHFTQTTKIVTTLFYFIPISHQVVKSASTDLTVVKISFLVIFAKNGKLKLLFVRLKVR